MKAQPRGVVIDASLRFVRSNPDLMRHARENAAALDVPADDLLLDAIARVVASRRAGGRHPTPTTMGACGVRVLAAGGAQPWPVLTRVVFEIDEHVSSSGRGHGRNYRRCMAADQGSTTRALMAAMARLSLPS